jgi:hypothetical protein
MWNQIDTFLQSRNTKFSGIYVVLCLKRIWGYIVPWVDNFTEEKSCVQRNFQYGLLGLILCYKVCLLTLLL